MTSRLWALQMLLVVTVIGDAMPVDADTLGFDDLTDPRLQQGDVPDGYGGFHWNNFYVLDGVDYPYGGGYPLAAVSPKMVIFNAWGAPASFSGSPFTFNSAYFTSALSNGLHVRADASLEGTVIHTKEFLLDTTGATLETFNWSGIDKVLFTSWGGDSAQSHFAVDNVTFNVPIPEPSAFALLAIGAGGVLAFSLRCRRGV
jgi:hypothetical protein